MLNATQHHRLNGSQDFETALRDRAAQLALVGLVGKWSGSWSHLQLAVESYQLADAMMTVRRMDRSKLEDM